MIKLDDIVSLSSSKKKEKNLNPFLRIFVGYDKIELLPYMVYEHSINKTITIPFSITPINLHHLQGIMSRERHPLQSNDFSFSRFLVPYLCNYSGWALYTDCDFLARKDLSRILNFCNEKYACLVVKHNYTVENKTKFLNKKQSKYHKKNWSSCILWNCGHESNRILTPELINENDTGHRNVGLYLHQLCFLKDEEIGELPRTYNHLVGVYDYCDDAMLVHWTNHGPWLEGFSDVDYANDWFASNYEMGYVVRK